MTKPFKLIMISCFVLILVGCSPTGIITKSGDIFVFGEPNLNWYVEFPSANYKIVNLDELLGPIKGTAFLQDKERNVSITLNIKPADGRKTAVECRNYDLLDRTIFTDLYSIHTYEKDSAAYAESDINDTTGYVGRVLKACYLIDNKEFSILVFVSQFDELKDRIICDNVFNSIRFKTR